MRAVLATVLACSLAGRALAAHSLAVDKLGALTTAARDGTFKQLGSVVVSWHGNMVYEQSFDGTDGAKHDLRSAGKSIASMLVGIALAQGHIKSLEVPVISYFNEYSS